MVLSRLCTYLQILANIFTCLYISIFIFVHQYYTVYTIHRIFITKIRSWLRGRGSDLDRFTGWKPQGVGGLWLPGWGVLQEVDGVVADSLQVRSSLLLLGRGLGEGRWLNAGGGVDWGRWCDLGGELVRGGWGRSYRGLLLPGNNVESVSVISLRVRDLLVLDDVPALVLLGELQVEVQLVSLLAGRRNAEPQ